MLSQKSTQRCLEQSFSLQWGEEQQEEREPAQGHWHMAKSYHGSGANLSLQTMFSYILEKAGEHNMKKISHIFLGKQNSTHSYHWFMWSFSEIFTMFNLLWKTLEVSVFAEMTRGPDQTQPMMLLLTLKRPGPPRQLSASPGRCSTQRCTWSSESWNRNAAGEQIFSSSPLIIC